MEQRKVDNQVVEENFSWEPAEVCAGHQLSEIGEVVDAVVQEYWRAQAEFAQYRGKKEVVRVDDLLCADWVGLAGLDFVGAGYSRVVVGLCPEHVLKVDFAEANDREVEVWRQADPEVRRMLAPIFGHGQHKGVSWLVMGRCEEMSLEGPEFSGDWLRLEGVSDWQVQNFGLWLGRQVMLDYADSWPGQVRLVPVEELAGVLD